MDAALLNQAELRLLKAAIRMNMIVMAIAFGLLGGSILWLSTVILLVRGGDAVGPHLSVLSVFLPGYSVTWSGAWIGLAWGVVLGALSGAIFYWSYATTLRERLTGRLLDVRDAARELTPPTVLISGNALGIALGVLLAVQLILTTNWLVLRGTAESSTNAALLGQYLPGYTVSFFGSVLGAIEVFVLAFVLSHVLASIYNYVARNRTR
ncbi:MAG TPA: hypothetical protein VE421_10775 [Burkholderiaceae bacterium]|nr:hypothetical protein [Burkholderiaceae bacterium]